MADGAGPNKPALGGVSFKLSGAAPRRTAPSAAAAAAVHEAHEDPEAAAEREAKRLARLKAEMVIPLQQVNRWAVPKAGAPEPTSAQDGTDKAQLTLEQEAAARLLHEAEGQATGQDGDAAPTIESIPLLMQNRVPGTDNAQSEDERFRQDVQVRPDAPDEETYDRVPIEAFGAALLRGMGWKEGEAIGGTNKGLIEPVEFVPRVRGLGLGATLNTELKQAPGHRDRKYIKPGESREAPKQMVARGEDGHVKHVRSLSEKLEEVEDLRLRQGAYVVIEGGPHAGHVGTAQRIHIRGVDVKLGLSGVVVLVPETDVKCLTRKGYEAQLAAGSKRQREQEEEQTRERSRNSGNGGSSSSSSKRSQHEHRSRSASPEVAAKRRDAAPSSVWVRANIRVRIISDSYKKGRHYNDKVRVVDVLSKDDVTCVDARGKVLEGLRQKDLETVIPKETNATVMIVRGRLVGRRGQLLDRDRSKSKALVQVAGEHEVLNLDFDDIAEYAGEYSSEDW